MDWLLPFATLTALELILGIDNLLFLSIVLRVLPAERRRFWLAVGLAGAFAGRALLLLLLNTLFSGEPEGSTPLITIWGRELGWRELILMGGGLFLLVKATREIYLHTELPARHRHPQEASSRTGVRVRPLSLILQITLVDIVFSVDSILTAIALTREPWIILSSIALSLIAMFFLPGWLMTFLDRHPSFLILALAFVWSIGLLLLLEGFHIEVPRSYVYFALAFSLVIELLQFRAQKHKQQAQQQTQEVHHDA